MTIKTFYCNPYRECTYIVEVDDTQCTMHNGASEHSDKCATHECIIIDPGMYGEKEEQRVMDYLNEHQLTPVAALITHRHPDHICGLEFLQKRFPLIKVDDGASEHSDKCTMHGCQLIKTPGHKEDSVCFYFEKEKVLFTGDTLFLESIGRTDLPGGDMPTLIRSLEILKKLPDDTQVYPGHGYPTTIGHEKEYNPYL